MTKDEVIEKYRKALALYADTNNWVGNVFRLSEDINNDDCSGKYCLNGEIARQALLHNEDTTVNKKPCEPFMFHMPKIPSYYAQVIKKQEENNG